MLCYLRALLFKNSWYHYVILQRWGLLKTNGCRQLQCRAYMKAPRSMTRLLNRAQRSNWQGVLVALAVVTLILAARQDVAAQNTADQPTRPTIKVLGIGNSFTGKAFSLRSYDTHSRLLCHIAKH